MAIILLLATCGLALIFLEFFLPGGVMAVLGTIALLISIGMFFADYPVLYGILYLLAILLAVTCTCRCALWRVKSSKKKGNFYHAQDQEGYVASSFDQTMIGKDGTVSTELKPAGHILVDGQLYQALSETGFISKGAPVQIIGGKGSHFIVRQRKL